MPYGPKRGFNARPYYSGATRRGKIGLRRTHGGQGRSYMFNKRYIIGPTGPFGMRGQTRRTWSAKTIPFVDKYKKAAKAQSKWRKQYQRDHGGWVA